MKQMESPIVQKAIDFARLSLAGKKRQSGEEIAEHCIKVAENLVRFKITDPSTLAVAVLHHSLHEGAATLEDIKKEFGPDIALMMEAFEKLRMIKPKSEMKDEFVENLRKMFLVLAKDLRVVMVKLTDIYDNLTTLQYVDADKREEVSRKTLEIFAPLAERLGMGEMRSEMQDLAFGYLYPKESEWVREYSKKPLQKLEIWFAKVRPDLVKALQEQGLEAEIQSRSKHMYSLYTKLQRPGFDNDISKIPDLLAARIIVDSEEDCYKALGVINKLFVLIQGRISDFIAHPKPNGYQSIHLKVYGPDEIPFEIQVRSRRMHEEAEYGVAAHWNYAEKKESGLSDEKISQGFAASAEKLEWVKRLSQWQEEISSDTEFLKTVKTDLFGTRIFCFTPKGDVKDLPYGATPVDFAYRVHTTMGDLMTGAKVNGRVVSLGTKLQNGDVVEINLSKDLSKKPSRDWLRFVVTDSAKRKIKKAYGLLKVN